MILGESRKKLARAAMAILPQLRENPSQLEEFVELMVRRYNSNNNIIVISPLTLKEDEEGNISEIGQFIKNSDLDIDRRELILTKYWYKISDNFVIEPSIEKGEKFRVPLPNTIS